MCDGLGSAWVRAVFLRRVLGLSRAQVGYPEEEDAKTIYGGCDSLPPQLLHLKSKGNAPAQSSVLDYSSLDC